MLTLTPEEPEQHLIQTPEVSSVGGGGRPLCLRPNESRRVIYGVELHRYRVATRFLVLAALTLRAI